MPGTCDGPRWPEKDSNHKMKTWGKAQLGGHDMVKRVDPNGETLVWCRKCSGCTRCRLKAKLMNRCRPEKKATKEYGNVFSKNSQTRRRKGTRQKRKRRGDMWRLHLKVGAGPRSFETSKKECGRPGEMSDKHPETVFGKGVSWSHTPQRVVRWSTRKVGRITALGGAGPGTCVSALEVRAPPGAGT